MTGPEAVEALPSQDIALWLGKILYGVLYKEGLLKRTRQGRRSGPIVSRAVLELFSMHHYLLQAIRVPMEFTPAFPASILRFRVQEPTNVDFQFDFRDSARSLAVSIRLGSVGILAALHDGGAQLGFAEYLARYQAVELHPLQFLELSAQFLYKVSLQRVTPKFLLHDAGDRIVVYQMPLGGTHAMDIFDAWDQKVYAEGLAAYTGFPFERLYHPPGQVVTWLKDLDGSVPHFDLVNQPWPAEMLSDDLYPLASPPEDS